MTDLPKLTLIEWAAFSKVKTFALYTDAICDLAHAEARIAEAEGERDAPCEHRIQADHLREALKKHHQGRFVCGVSRRCVACGWAEVEEGVK